MGIMLSGNNIRLSLMDIIQLGDFSISNGGGETLFSFAIPPFKNKTDYFEKALSINKRNRFNKL
jgi:hypothetical protein